ncbi:MAG: hypothetical protein JWN00_2933 [Actinomycetia bacterium]|nr:hypothetical protein [Actinomycetes bacterium]
MGSNPATPTESYQVRGRFPEDRETASDRLSWPGRRSAPGAGPAQAVHQQVEQPRGLVALTLKIYYRASGKKAWKAIGTATTGTNGEFIYNITGRPHGYYKAVFNPATYYLSVTSASTYFSG